MPEFEAPAVAPEWSKFAGARLADLPPDDLRDLHRQARVVSLRRAIEHELKHRTRRKAHPPAKRAFQPRVTA